MLDFTNLLSNVIFFVDLGHVPSVELEVFLVNGSHDLAFPLNDLGQLSLECDALILEVLALLNLWLCVISAMIGMRLCHLGQGGVQVTEVGTLQTLEVNTLPVRCQVNQGYSLNADF